MKLFERMSAEGAIIGIIIAVVILARLISFAHLSSLASKNPAAHPYPVISGDSSYYALWADNLLAFRAYENPKGVPLHAAPPGYPALLAATKALTGSMMPVIILQIILSAVATVLIYRMGRAFVPKALAIIPAFVYALDPMVILSDTTIMTDGLFSALFVCIVYLAFFQSRVTGVARWALAGLLLGTAIMIRPIAQFLVIVFPALYLLREWMSGQNQDGSRFKMTCTFVIACGLVLTPWMLRNEIQFGSFEISPLGGHNLLTFDVRGFLAWRSLREIGNPMPVILVLRHANDPIFALVDENIATELTSITPPGENRENYEGRLAMQYIMRDPIRYTYFHLANTIPFFISSSVAYYRQIARQLRSNEGFYAPTLVSLMGSFERIRNPESMGSFTNALRSVAPIAIEVFWWLLVAFLAITAFVFHRRDFNVLLCAVLVLYFAVLTGPMSMARYRIPAEPYLLVLAVTGAHEIVRRRILKPIPLGSPILKNVSSM